MKAELERRITNKEEQIKKLRMEINGLIQNAKKLTFEEYDISFILVNLGTKINKCETEITKLQYEVYDLMQILKSE